MQKRIFRNSIYPEELNNIHPLQQRGGWKKEGKNVDRILYNPHTVHMTTITYTNARNSLAQLIDSTEQNRQPVSITRNGKTVAVLLSPEEYAGMEETLHLLSTPANAERIRQGLRDYAKGNLREAELCD